ncbi:MAG: hypothetical protein JOZ72_02090 [Alphaproteobacteria bacterium]|nr:hypothetical protein [Alphaproteobacteria bacterium]
MFQKAPLGPYRHQLILGVVHLGVGVLMSAVLCLFNFDFIAFFRHANLALGLSVLVFGFVKGTYGIGSVFPGQTLVLIAIIGLSCNMQALGLPLLLVWLGVMAGLILSYSIGWATHSFRQKGEAGARDGFNWKEVVFVVTPTAASTYFFNMGYWRRSILVRLLWYGVAGGLLLVTLSCMMCIVKSILAPRVETLSTLYSLGLAAYGLLTIVYVIWRSQKQVPDDRAV